MLEDILQRLRAERGVDSNVELTKDIQFYPDFHGAFNAKCVRYTVYAHNEGNRSPVADPRMRGSIVGLDLVNTFVDLGCSMADVHNRTPPLLTWRASMLSP